MICPLAVLGEMVPHKPAEPQVSVHWAPAFAVSYVKVPVRLTVPFTCALAVAGVTAISIGGGGVTVTVTVAAAAGFVVDAATIITVDPAGTLDGALYVMGWPLAVWLAAELPTLRLPQSPAVPHG